MTDLECMIKALRMAWIPRLLKEGHQNGKLVPDHFFKRYGSLEFLLNCDYSVKFFENLTRLKLSADGPFAASGHMVHAGGQATHWDIQNKENSNLS